MKTKICKSCGAEKAISDYYVRKDGWVFSRCKQCYLAGDKRRGDFADHQHKEHARKQKAAWRSKRPEYDRAQKANSRASKMGVDGILTAEQVKDVWDKWSGCCWICGHAANQLDHFRPLNKRAGGTNTPDNVRPICNSCNHKRDHCWHGEETAMREAEMLRAIQEMLRDSSTASAGLTGSAAGGLEKGEAMDMAWADKQLPPGVTRQDVCIWTQDSDGPWCGSCGVMWEFIDGGPKDNETHFCPRCGGVLLAEPFADDETPNAEVTGA